MALKWYHDADGDISSGRLMAVPGFYIGAVVILASVVALFIGNPQAIAMAGIGSTVALACLGLKTVAKKIEDGK